MSRTGTRRCSACGRRFPAEYDVCPGCGIVYGDPPGASAWKRILDIGAVLCVLILVSAFALWAAGLLIL